MPTDVKAFLSDYPELLAEWDYSHNADLDPRKVRHRTSIKVWWKCSEGHEWQARVANRTNGSGCPVCAMNRGVQARYVQRITSSGSLASTNPLLAAEWHPSKNGDLTPSSVTPSSNKKVWWLCEKGHEWLAIVASRNNNTSQCPYCSGRATISGVNDLATTNPSLAAEWHPTRNENLIPSEVKPASNKKVWWQCSSGHEWVATISSRSWGNGCPICDRNRRASNRIIGSISDETITKSEASE